MFGCVVSSLLHVGFPTESTPATIHLIPTATLEEKKASNLWEQADKMSISNKPGGHLVTAKRKACLFTIRYSSM